MRVYVNSAGVAPEHDYRWTAGDGAASGPCFARDAERRAFFAAFGCDELVRGDRPRLALARSGDGRLLLAAVAFPTAAVDYANRPVRVTVCWEAGADDAERTRLLGLFGEFKQDWVGTLGRVGGWVATCRDSPGYAARFIDLVRLEPSAPTAEAVPSRPPVGVLMTHPSAGTIEAEGRGQGKVPGPAEAPPAGRPSGRSIALATASVSALALGIGFFVAGRTKPTPPPARPIPPVPRPPEATTDPAGTEAAMAVASPAAVATLSSPAVDPHRP